MKEKKLTGLTLCRLIIMILMIVLSCVSAGIVFTGNIPEGFVVNSQAYKTSVTLYGIAHIANALALAHGIMYLLKGSGKQAAGYYRTFILLVALGIVLRLIGTLFYPGFGLSACLMIGILLMLLALGFVKDLGEQKSWIIFWVLIILEVVLAVVMFDKNEAMSSIAGSLSRLVLDASIGLSLRAKYADKAARGTR